MAYVSVPNDLTKIKSKLAFNLTKRQLICFGGAALIGIPTYLLTRSVIGNTAAMLLMIVLMLPCFSSPCTSATGCPLKRCCGTLSVPGFCGPGHGPTKPKTFTPI